MSLHISSTLLTADEDPLPFGQCVHALVAGNLHQQKH